MGTFVIGTLVQSVSYDVVGLAYPSFYCMIGVPVRSSYTIPSHFSNLNYFKALPFLSLRSLTHSTEKEEKGVVAYTSSYLSPGSSVGAAELHWTERSG